MFKKVLAILVVGLSLAGCAGQDNSAELAAAQAAANAAAEAEAKLQANTEVVVGFLEGVFNDHQVQEAFDKYVGTTYIQHQPKVADGVEAGIRGLTYVTTQMYPDTRIEIKRTAAQDDLVWVHMRQVRDENDEASGGGLAIAEIFRVTDGLITEHWDVVQEIILPADAKNQNGMF